MPYNKKRMLTYRRQFSAMYRSIWTPVFWHVHWLIETCILPQLLYCNNIPTYCLVEIIVCATTRIQQIPKQLTSIWRCCTWRSCCNFSTRGQLNINCYRLQFVLLLLLIVKPLSDSLQTVYRQHPLSHNNPRRTNVGSLLTLAFSSSMSQPRYWQTKLAMWHKVGKVVTYSINECSARRGQEITVS